MKQHLKKRLPDWFIDHFKIKRQFNIFKNKPIDKTFTYINGNKYWKSKESVSGDRSEIEVTKPLVNELNTFLKEKKIGSILDIPSGDFNWMQNVDFGKCK